MISRQMSTKGWTHTDGRLAARGTILRRDLEKAICINLKGCNELGLAARHGRNAIKLELAKQTIVTTLSPLAFVTVTSCKSSGVNGQSAKNIHGKCHSRLIVLNRSEDTGLVGRDRCVPRNDNSEYIALHRDTQGEWSNIKQQ